ncbi:MAG: helix-turn-helix domain-containing protein [Kiritimatiellae bacterium]|nr:helix-turn-helix domain-containing protein [Kiritimatiellia bacterium]
MTRLKTRGYRSRRSEKRLVVTARQARRCDSADRIFASTGKSINGRIEETRLDRAMTFLRTSTMTQREIAAKCGFASETCLSRISRRKFGRPPGKFRK